ncbi:bleomycin resistance protein [Nonomuraea sp. PA05]|uniref:VOC family protein n=1 Tax=Nonomuraea sp. PA05 TaxID=2604466 RepID=UPI0011D453B4|nr:VOC family protein [Nonomuraea sp. PA05]TYB54708.1 bleomycin resistance protein [Nonomuraea sp. PA05]
MEMTQQDPEPQGENTVNGFVVVDGAAPFIDFLIAVFDATERREAHTPDFYAGDGTLIHAEVEIGNSLLMVADRKGGWPFTPALTQVYVADPEETMRRAVERGATVVTPVSAFYGGYGIARFLDPWHNLWWLFFPAAETEPVAGEEPGWEESAEPGPVYTTLLETMATLADPRAGGTG